jgi:hypothetical protein
MTEPTRVTSSTATLIDHIYTNHKDHCISSGLIEYSVSDHDLIYTIKEIGVKRQAGEHKIKYRDFSNFTPKNIIKSYVGVT